MTRVLSRRLFEGQALHTLGLTALLALAYGAAGLLDLTDRVAAWYWGAIGVAVFHQVYVWLCWRSELHGRHLTRLLGRGAFPVYAVGFVTLVHVRFGVLFPLAAIDRESLSLPTTVREIAVGVLAIPVIYVFYSVLRYFTFPRAFGNDHFLPDAAARPFERRGIFRYADNAMYTYGFLFAWLPGLWWGSLAALAAAAFNHAYIWVHYYATERPDIAVIYGRRT